MDCIFCKIALGQIPANILHQDDEMVAFRDVHPQAPVHILIIPKKHYETILDLPGNEMGLLGRMVNRANTLAKEEGIAQDGFRLVINCRAGAGQTVFHLHLHLLGGRTMGWPPG